MPRPNTYGATYAQLHHEGMSTRQIADKLGHKKNTVLCSLRRSGVLRQSKGRDIELQVAGWLYPMARSVFHMKGDHSFDLLVEGRRVDVKSACRSTDGSYHFELNHRGSKSNYIHHVDEFYLVFKSEAGLPVYRLSAREVMVRRTLNISNIETTRYNLQLMGYLEAS